MQNPKIESQARRLREVLRGKITQQETACRLIQDYGSESGALDFILNGDEDAVRDYLNKDPDYIRELRRDGQRVASLLENGLDATVRQFACRACNKSWWKKVPARKEVSKCNRCKVKYDPIPRDKEFGIGKFLCECGNEFTGFGEMNVTSSKCYKCGQMVPVDHMLPPRKDRPRKTRLPHSCNGVNCPGHAHDADDVALVTNFGRMQIQDPGAAGYGRWGGNSPGGVPGGSAPCGGPGSYGGSGSYAGSPGSRRGLAAGNVQPVCVHPKAGNQIRTFSERHRSTGSTVTTFLSQGSLDNMTVSQFGSLDAIVESD
ncbi:shiftless antiviral inhibitor of ribosomal frameshifting protein homolog [Physella acuta]|uniref:shiftless antiviral inhibitor of ribosomal frameshifting protein homolog n=1 Tax=Physella acuta TaxID=109671 RepID=UPI0027DD53B6|nr:shiftless antiviral inhibitor of ribosomal frameshifting protein homolog [Physella acuta]